MLYQSVKIKQIKKLTNVQIDRYDLEVDNAHNYFANNILVHNCRSLFNKQSGFISRQGKNYNTLNHLTDEANQLFNNLATEVGHENIWLDGELYTDNLSFQNIISAIKRDEPNTLTPEIQYHIYDAIIPNVDYEDRMFYLRNAFSQQMFKSLINVETYEIDSKEAIDGFHSHYIQQGKEGVMLRNKSGYYTIDKRSHNLQKVKKFDDAEFEIINYKIDKNNHAVFECVTDNGDVFEVKPMGDTETRDMYTDDAESLIGEYLTVKYFGMTTGDNPVPRFPVGVSIRNFED